MAMVFNQKKIFQKENSKISNRRIIFLILVVFNLLAKLRKKQNQETRSLTKGSWSFSKKVLNCIIILEKEKAIYQNYSQHTQMNLKKTLKKKLKVFKTAISNIAMMKIRFSEKVTE